MALYTGNRATSGDGTAVVTAAAGSKLKIGKYIFLQLQEAGPVVCLLKFGSTTIHAGIGISNINEGVVLMELPTQTSGTAEALYVNLSASKSVNYAIEVEAVGA